LDWDLFIPRWFAVLHAYFDDSGKESDPSHRFVCLAGFFGPAVWMADFASAWQGLLIKHEIRDFHMKKLMSEDFMKRKGWDEPKRRSVIGDFIALVNKSDLIPVGCAIDADYWRTFSKERQRLLDSPQLFCFQRVLRRIVDRQESADDSQYVAIYVDRDVAYSGARLQQFNKIKARDKRADRFVQITFADAAKVAPLQAADLLAWETRLHLLRRAQNKPSTPRWKELLEAVPEREAIGELWDFESSEDLLAAAEEDAKRNQRGG
jgi:hypothetical protein